MGFWSCLFGLDDEVQYEASYDIVEQYRAKYQQMARAGKDISWYEFDESVRQGFPYPCATEMESRKMSWGETQPICGDVKAIGWLLHWYTNGLLEDENDESMSIYRDEQKAEYWKNWLIEEAAQGNRMTQAALVNNLGVAFNGAQANWLTQEEYDEFCTMYKTDLIADAEQGDPDAMLAVAEYDLRETGDTCSEENAEYIQRAAEKGVPDAYYYLAKNYYFQTYKKNKNFDYNSPENAHYYQLLLKAAKTNQGAHIGYVQYLIAEAYYDGDIEGFPKDMKQFRYWLEQSAQNGYWSAISRLERQ